MSNSHPSTGSIMQLNIVITDILSPTASRAYSFKAFVKNRIRQFNLTDHLEPNEVINEAYKRAIAAVEAGKEIQNWQAWLKSTCFNIIREHSRAGKKCSTVDPQSIVLANLQACNAISVSSPEGEETTQIVEEQINILNQALHALAEEDQHAILLLKLRLLDGHSWEYIREYLLANTNEELPSQAALRQRAARAKRRLRRLYHRIEESTVGKRC